MMMTSLERPPPAFDLIPYAKSLYLDLCSAPPKFLPLGLPNLLNFHLANLEAWCWLQEDEALCVFIADPTNPSSSSIMA